MLESHSGERGGALEWSYAGSQEASLERVCKSTNLWYSGCIQEEKRWRGRWASSGKLKQAAGRGKPFGKEAFVENR